MEVHPTVSITSADNILTFSVAKVDKKEEKSAWAQAVLQELILLI